MHHTHHAVCHRTDGAATLKANDLIILYPQLHYGSRATCAAEADDCWDQGGSTGDSYSDHAGAQVKAVMAMVQRLQEAPVG
jgi:hypothetical protein